MKVLDIITETAPSPEAIRNLTGDQITQFLDHWNRTNPHNNRVNYTIDPADENFFQRFLRNRQNLIAAEEARVTAAMGWMTPVIRWGGFITTVVMWRMRMLAINEMAGEKNPDGSYKYKTSEILDKRNQATGMFVTSQLMEWIIRSIAGGRLISSLAMLLRGAAVGLGGRGGIWAAAITFISSELLIQGLKIWLNTDAGREWFCRNWLVKMLVGGLGALTENVIGEIVDAIKSATGVDLDTTPNITKRDREATKFDLPKIDPKQAAAADMKDRINRYVPDENGQTFATRP